MPLQQKHVECVWIDTLCYVLTHAHQRHTHNTDAFSRAIDARTHASEAVVEEEEHRSPRVWGSVGVYIMTTLYGRRIKVWKQMCVGDRGTAAVLFWLLCCCRRYFFFIFFKFLYSSAASVCVSQMEQSHCSCEGSEWGLCVAAVSEESRGISSLSFCWRRGRETVSCDVWILVWRRREYTIHGTGWVSSVTVLPWSTQRRNACHLHLLIIQDRKEWKASKRETGAE